MISKIVLLELARKEFASAHFSRAEEELFRAAQTGQVASAASGDEMQDDPANAGNWHADRVVRAECIAWLCTDREASALVTHRGILIEGMRIDGKLELTDAEIKFPLRFSGSAFTGGIFLRESELRTLALLGCRIKELDGLGLNVQGSVFLLYDFKAEGMVFLSGATIGGVLDCSGAEFSNSNGPALTANRIQIQGSLFLHEGFKAKGEVSLLGATIGGDLRCSGAEFLNSNGQALTGNGIQIQGSLFLHEGFKAKGEVSLLRATIGGDLDCSGAEFLNSNGPALTAERSEIKGSVFLRDDFKAKGEVRLLGATIGGNLQCDGAEFLNLNGPALTADGLRITGAAHLRDGFRAEGRVTLALATMDGLQIRDILASDDVVLDLRSAKVGTFWDDEHSWPKAGNLFLDGFRYERLFEGSPLDAKSRKKWLHRQPSDRFLPQPYEHLAAILRRLGHERDARVVMIAKNRERARFSHFPQQSWWWYNLFGRIIGYGYEPWRAFAMSVAMIVLGWFLFAFGSSHDLISPAKESAYEKNSNGQFVLVNEKRKLADNYPVFNPFVYSLESFTPLLSLDQSANWMPNANRSAKCHLWRWQVTVTGSELRVYLWIHIITGWLLTTLWVGAVTGLVKS